MACVKRTEVMSHMRRGCEFIFSTECCIFYARDKNYPFSLKQLCGHVECGDICVKNFVRFFYCHVFETHFEEPKRYPH